MRKKPEKQKTVSIRLTERELYLLDDGFGTSYIPDEEDKDIKELMRIRAKLMKAQEKFY